MPQFNVGDKVRLASINNGSKAFRVLTPNTRYTVEDVGPTCAFCTKTFGSLAPHFGHVKILGAAFCAEAFEPHPAGHTVQGVPASPANAPIQPQAPTGASPIKVSKDKYSGAASASGAEWDDNLPDPTTEDHKRLPTLTQLNEEWYKKHGHNRPC